MNIRRYEIDPEVLHAGDRVKPIYVRIIDPRRFTELFAPGEIVLADVITDGVMSGNRCIPVRELEGLWEFRLDGIRCWMPLSPLELLALATDF